MIKRYSDIHDENLLTVINNLQNNHDLPFDAFLKVERGNNIDGSSCWRLVLKGKQGFFFWFRADFQNYKKGARTLFYKGLVFLLRAHDAQHFFYNLQQDGGFFLGYLGEP